MDTRQPILQDIRTCPGIYLGRKSLMGLRDFINGYMLACRKYGIGECQGIPEDFHDWAACRTRFDEPTSGWCGMITEAAGSDELAFDRFFELLDEYENRQPAVFARIGNSGTVLVTFSDDPGFFAVREGEWKSSLRGRFFPTLKRFGAEAGSLEIVDPEVFARIKAAEAEQQRRRIDFAGRLPSA